MEKMQANSIMDEKKRESNNDNNEELITSNNKFNPTLLSEKNLSYDFYADSANKQEKEKSLSPNYQQIDNTGKLSYTSEVSDISNCLTVDKKNSNIAHKLREDRNKENEELKENENENKNPTLKQFISNVKSINSNNKIPISISIENKSTSSLFKSDSQLKIKEDYPHSSRKCSQTTSPVSPGFHVVLLLEKSNSISFIVDFQEIDNNINNESKENESNKLSNDNNTNNNKESPDSNGIVLFPIYQNKYNNIYQNHIIQMKGDGGDSLSPIKLTPINSNKRKEFRKKDIISRLDPKYLKYEKLIADEIRRRKSNTEKNSLELNNFINNKLMKASLLREKFYQKRRLNLKEKHDHIIDIYMKRKKAINISNQKNNILRSKIMLARLAKKNNIDNSIEKDSLISSDSSLFSSSDSLLSSSSNIDFNCLSENTILKENKTKENLNKNQDNNNSLSKNIEKNEIEINSKDKNESKTIEDNSTDNKGKNKNINSHNNNNENTTTTNNNNNNNNNNNTVAVMSNGKEFDSNKENLSKNSIKSDIDDNSVTQNNPNSNKDSKNIESTKSQESKINNSHHHHRHHHHRNGKNNHNKMKLNEISTDILDNISLYDTKLVIPYLPPVTRYTLRELDTDEIITNPQLRHDLYFDPKLQFKPNTDGERGVQKKMKADLCWKEIDYEINHLHNYKRIPLLINEIKCILKEMISYVKDFAEEIDSNIDIQLIAQEIKHGVFVPDNLISYIAKTLKVHCAPARDEYIDKIEELSKQNKFIETLKLIYEVLELMKLDLANHQLTRIRPYVLTHTVEFEWKFFKDQLEKKIFQINWLQMSLQNQPANSSFNSVFYAGFLKLLLTYNQNRIIPETFRLDKSRIVTFYNEWQDITILSCLLLIFRQACSSKCTSENVLNLKQRLYVLLTSQSTSLKHINLEITNMAGQIRKKEFSTKEIDLISGLVEKTLSPDSKLYVMIQTRISTYIVHFLNNDELPKELMYRHNMNEMEPEISTLSGKIKGVVELNLQTYSEYYKTIFLELKQQKTNSLIKTLNNAKNENNSLTKIQNQVSSSNGNKTSINNAPPSSSPSLSLSSEVTKMKLQVSHNSDIVVHNVSNNSQNNSHDSKSNSQI